MTSSCPAGRAAHVRPSASAPSRAPSAVCSPFRRRTSAGVESMGHPSLPTPQAPKRTTPWKQSMVRNLAQSYDFANSLVRTSASITSTGCYLSAQLWKHPPGSRGQIATALMEPTPARGECLMFWYYMEGNAVGQLNVYLRTSDAPVKLWSRSGDQGSRWRHGRVSLLSPDTPYQVGLRLLFDLNLPRGTCQQTAVNLPPILPKWTIPCQSFNIFLPV